MEKKIVIAFDGEICAGSDTVKELGLDDQDVLDVKLEIDS
jgi:Ubiquitin-2 like Rad60 SUMO-like